MLQLEGKFLGPPLTIESSRNNMFKVFDFSLDKVAAVVILRARWLQNSCVFRWVKVVFFGCERWGKGGFLEDQPRCYSLNSLIFDSLT